MKKTRYSDEQIVRILREADQSSVAEASIYLWKKRFGVMEKSEVKKLESENAMLKKLLAERDLEIEVMKEIAEKKW